MGRPAGSGTVSHKRRQAYRETQARREDWNSRGWRTPSQERADAEKAKEEEKKEKRKKRRRNIGRELHLLPKEKQL